MTDLFWEYAFSLQNLYMYQNADFVDCTIFKITYSIISFNKYLSIANATTRMNHRPEATITSTLFNDKQFTDGLYKLKQFLPYRLRNETP